MFSHRIAVFASAMLAPAVLAQDDPVQQTAPFEVLTNNYREFANLNVEAVRGVIWSSVDTWIYGLNTHASLVVVHSNLDGAPDFTWQTVSLPVAIAEWQSNRILVVGGGTHALAVHDRNGGAILKTIQLPSEPADIVVDHDHDLAYVSCQGTNQVVKINLTTMAIAQIVDVPAERPRFLYFDAGTDATTDNRVFVAPFTSGNNSMPLGPAQHRPDQPWDQELNRVHDLDADPTFDLPDQDLFVITSTTAASTIQPSLRSAGTLLMAHGRHPSGAYWICNIEGRNKDATLNNEPALNGQFAFNRVSIGQPVAGANPLPQPTAIDIDDTTPGGATRTYSTATSLSFPWSLAFHPTGIVVVSASTSDRLGVFDAAGNRITALDVQLDPGSIPRHIQFDPVIAQFLVVHCWGSNLLEIYTAGQPTPHAVLELGHDPTPEPIREGREIWYDAARSLHGRTTCNTCHPAGKTDLLVWPLSDPPHDHKDPMVTQSLLSIEDTFPYHWRGERDLLAFNGAFTGLLGGAQALSTTGADPEFEELQEFIFSLQAHANPIESHSREVNDAIGAPPGGAGFTFAVQGQDDFINLGSFGANLSCNDCHTLPTSSNNDFNLGEFTFVPSQTSVEVAHLREMTHRDLPTIPTGWTFPLPGLVNRNGVGLTHSGDLLNLAAAMGNFVLSPQQELDIAAFVRQLDNGLAPAAHLAFLLSPTTQSNAATIQTLLHPQAGNGWIDVVAFGDHQPTGGGAVTPVRWLFDPATALYQANETSLFPTPINLTALAALANAGGTLRSITVLGMPPGDGRRFALDPDNDYLLDAAEPTGTFADARRNPDSDGDGFQDGYEVHHGASPAVAQPTVSDTSHPTIQGFGPGGAMVHDLVTTAVAKFFATTSEDSIIEVVFSTPGLPAKTYLNANYARLHTIVLQGLEASTLSTTRQYTATFTAIDRAGNRTLVPPTATFTAAPLVNAPALAQPTFVVRSFTGVRNTSAPSGTLDITQTAITLEQRDFGGSPTPPSLAGHVVAAQVLIRPAGTTAWQVSNTFTSSNSQVVPTFFVWGPLVPIWAQFLILPSPFVLSQPTTSSGVANIAFTQPGLQANDEVVLRVVSILTAAPPATGQPANTFNDLSLGAYQMPATAADARAISFTY